MSTERKVKGSVLLDMVKVIRAFKDKDWSSRLTPEDWQIVNSMVIPTQWYPIETYQRMGTAVFELVAGKSEQALRAFGQAAVKELLEGPYKPFLQKDDPFEALAKFLDLRRGLFNFSRMEIRKTGDKSAIITISDIGEFETGLDIFISLLDVHLQGLVEKNGGKNVSCKPRDRNVEGQKLIEFEMAWA